MQPINLHEVKDGDVVSGLLYISFYTKKLDPASRAPVNGQATYKGKSMGFKIWDSYMQHIFNTNDLTGSIIAVKARAGVYKDNLELTLEEINFNHGVTDTSIFFKSVDVEKVFADFVEFMRLNLSEKGMILLSNIFKNENLTHAFKTCWAGSKMHDAQVGGLMNHTLKMLRLAKTLMENDSRLTEWSDLIYICIIFHDIGKIYEINEGGVYTPNSFVTHRTLGTELVIRQKDLIVEAYGETFFYHILAVQQQHHGKEFGDNPTTIWSYIIHLIDMLESVVTGFLDRMEAKDYNIKNGQKQVWFNGTNLVV